MISATVIGHRVVRGGEIECVDEFIYLQSLIMVNGRLDAEVDI